MSKLRPIAIHLPQFHPFAENDAWWGKGFTEWTTTAKAKPLFDGHYQPHVPADLGFYDLRLQEARMAQIELAKAYGIQGFCYYHYWFNGKRLMQEPIDQMLENPKEDFPFMLCWANENWTKTWDGDEKSILIEQKYSDDDDLAHIRFLCLSVFSDQRYIRVNGKPFFVFYRPTLFPDINKTIKTWRAEAIKLGIGELYIGFMNSFNIKYDHEKYDFDVSIEFAPHFTVPKRIYHSTFNKIVHDLAATTNRLLEKINQKWLLKLGYGTTNRIKKACIDPSLTNILYNYEDMVNQEMNRRIPERTYPSLFPMWDNSARRQKDAYIAVGSTPELYGKWLTSILQRFKPLSKDENFIFLNAWNEWGEGNHLEPDLKWKRKYLEITKEVLEHA